VFTQTLYASMDTMRTFIIISFFLLTLSSCNKNKPEKIEFKPNDRLIDFDMGLVLNQDDIIQLKQSEYELINSKKFNPKTDTIKYKDREISVSYLTFTKGCAEYGGDIKIKEDSIYLELIHTNGIVCGEEVCDRVKFRIRNPENRKYKIIKQ
jgi:hypothetical protein